MVIIDREHLTCIGIVLRAHGIRGELKVLPQTDQPAYYSSMKQVFLVTEGDITEHHVKSCHLSNGLWRMGLEGITDRNEAEARQGSEVMLATDQLRPLETGEFFQHDLVGCQVVTLEGETVGTVSALMETGANDVLEVTGKGETILIPLVMDVVKEVDTAGRIIKIDPIPGLLDQDDM